MWGRIQDAKTVAEVLKALPQLLTDAGIGFQTLAVYQYEGKSPTPILRVSPHPELRNFVEPVVRLVWEEKRAALVERVLKPSPPDELSVMAVPLQVVGETLGVIYVGARKPGAYGDRQFDAFQNLAAPVAAFLQAARQQPEMNQVRFQRDALKNEQQNLVDTLTMLMDDLERAQGPRHCLTAATTALQRAIPGVTSALALLIEPREQSLVSPHPEEFADVRTDGGLFARAARHGAILVRDAYYLIERERSAIAAPLLSGDVLQGFIYVGSPQPKSFSEDHKQLTSVIAVATAHAVRALSLAQEIRTGWMTDTATGVFTHRYFRSRLSDELALCRRNDEPLWVAVLDLDKFSTYNSEQGHRDGDRMLRKAADVLSGEMPEGGILARYGGDEFALAVRGQDKAKGAEFAERLRVLCKEQLEPLTVSLGVAAAPEDGMRALELLQAAEQALFVSKSEGRDRVGPAL